MFGKVAKEFDCFLCAVLKSIHVEPGRMSIWLYIFAKGKNCGPKYLRPGVGNLWLGDCINPDSTVIRMPVSIGLSFGVYCYEITG